MARTSAAIEGPRWGARAVEWAELLAPLSVPVWERVAEATEIGPGTRVLDVGCGSGEFCRLAAERGAEVSGLDAAAGMIGVARRLVPGAALRVGAMEALPWPDARFDVVTGFNAFAFAADRSAALAEARRVARPGGRVAACVWGRPGDSGLLALMGALRPLGPPPPPGPAPPPAMGEPGVLEGLLRAAGLEPGPSHEVDVPLEVPDSETLERAVLAAGAAAPAVERAGEAAVRRVIAEAAGPFRRPDGSYRLENAFRYVVARAPAAAP